LELGARLKFCRCKVPLVLVSDPTLLLAVSSASWSSRCSSEARSNTPHSTSTISPFLQSVPTVGPSRVTAVVRLLSWTSCPYSTCQVQRSTHSAGFHAAFVPPSGFGYPLDGLLPLNPSGDPKISTALLGFSPSKHCPPVSCSCVSAPTAPHAVSSRPYAGQSLDTAAQTAASGT
jgi:hypothetical protein